MKTNFNSYLTPILFITLVSGSIFFRRTAELVIHDDLKNDAEVFEVKGKQDPQMGQTVPLATLKQAK